MLLCCCVPPQKLLPESVRMLGSTRSLVLPAWGSSRLPPMNLSSSVCMAFVGCREILGMRWLDVHGTCGGAWGKGIPTYQPELSPPKL